MLLDDRPGQLLPPSQDTSPQPLPFDQRLLSLDALRGFTMFWIAGGRDVVLGLIARWYPPLLDDARVQLAHPAWGGFVAWDMIMPTFLFVVGVAMPFALARRIEQGRSWGAIYERVACRVIALWALGIIYQAVGRGPVQVEFYGNALQAIAVGYLVTSIALLHLPVAGQIVLVAVLVMGYWGLLTFVPFAGYPAGTLLPHANFARYVDDLLLGSDRGSSEFTWVITSLGFAATVLLGAVAGHLLRAQMSSGQKLFWLVVIGCGLMVVGWQSSYWLPLNRHLWTSSMVLWAGGWGFMLLAVFYAVIDVARSKEWAFPFVVIGANALLAYMLVHFLDVGSYQLVLMLRKRPPTPYAKPLIAAGLLAALWLFLWVLYRKRIFLRV